MTSPQCLPNPRRHTVLSSARSFNLQYPLLYLTSSCSCLRLLLRLPVTSILPSIYPSITCLAKQFQLQMWPIQSVFLLSIVHKVFLSLWNLHNNSPSITRSFQLIYSILLQHHISKHSRCFWSTLGNVQVSAPHKAVHQMWHFSSSNLIPICWGKSLLLVECCFCKGNAAFNCTSRAACVICYHATKIIEIFHILQFHLSIIIFIEDGCIKEVNKLLR